MGRRYNDEDYKKFREIYDEYQKSGRSRKGLIIIVGIIFVILLLGCMAYSSSGDSLVDIISELIRSIGDAI